MFEWIDGIYGLVMEVIDGILSYMNALVTAIDSISFEQVGVIDKSLGMIRYVVGDALYVMFFTLISIAAMINLWKLVKVFLNALFSIVPYIKAHFE